ncbi:MAG: cytochrome c oxidase subunit II [Alphaproteobacteria bacterium]|nr:cytochrome c oxidase subunit II [Alphaproteobacteria bacterium]
MAVALILIALVAGSVMFHMLSPWWWTPIASNWQYIDRTMIITFWITGLVFIAVVLFMAYCLIRFRHVEGRVAAYEPENRKLEIALAAGTALGVAAMLAPGLLVWNSFITVPRGTNVVEVVGQQWQWSFRLPGKQGRLGLADTRLVSADNPLGLIPGDPNSQDNVLVIGGDLHLPVGQPVKFLLRSIDVVHDFYVPEFRAKMDLMPGIVTYFWFTPTRPGTFEILCAGFCGVGHPFMRGNVIVESQEAYQAWLNSQTTFAQTRRAQAEAPQRDAAR